MIPADNLFQWQPWRTYAADFGVSTPENGLLSDMAIQNYVWKSYIRETLFEGDIPLWNPHLFGGAPFLATGQNAAYYPFSILFLIMPLAKAYGWYTVSQLWLAGFCMFLFMRVLRLRPGSAFIAGLIFQGCGFMLVSAAVFPMIIGAAAWLPLCLACLEMVINTTTNRLGDGRTLPWAALGALALGCQILAGHIEITYYTLIVMALYAAWRLASRWIAGVWEVGQGPEFWRRLARPPAWLLITVIIGLMLGGIQFIPFYEVGSTNFREGSATLEQIRDWAFPERRALTLFLPDFFGNPADHTYTDALTGETIPFSTNYDGNLNPHGAQTSNWGIKNYVEGGIYLGILPLVLALLGVWYGLQRGTTVRGLGHGIGRRRSAVAFFSVLSLLSLAFIFGTPLYAILYYGFPGINQLHSPFRWVFPLSLCVAALAAYGMEGIRLDHRPQTTDHKRFACLRSVVCSLMSLSFLAGLSLFLILWLSRFFYTSVEPLIEPIFLGLAQAAEAFPSTRAFYSYQYSNAQHLALMLIAAGFVLWVSQRPFYLPNLVPPPSFSDRLMRLPRLQPFVWRVSGWLMRQGDPRPVPLYISLAAGVIIIDLFVVGYGFNASVDPKLLEFKPQMIEWLEQQPDPHLWRVTTFDNKGTKPFNANLAWMTGFQDVRGYDSIIAKQYVEYMKAIEPQNELDFNRIQPIGSWEALNSPLVDLLGVKYVITEETLDLPKLQLAWEGEGVRVYENLAAMPRAYLLADTATVISVPQQVYKQMQEVDPRYFAIVVQDPAEPMQDDLSRTLTHSFFGPADPQNIRINQYTNRQILIDAQPQISSWLVLNDTYFSGWRAFVRPVGTTEDDEVEKTIYRVNGNFRGVLLEPGEWTIRFQYTPFTQWLGLLTSAMGAILVAFAVVVWGWRRFYRPQGELTNTRSIAKNSLAPMTLNLFNRGIDFLFAAYYLRLLGPDDAGAYATAITIAGLYEILSNFGLNAYLIREVSQDKSRTSSYLLNTTILRLGTGALASLPILLYTFSTGYEENTIWAVGFLMIGMVFSGMAAGLTGLFYAYEEAEIPAAVTTVTTLMKVGFGVVVLLAGFGFVALAANSILVNVITLILLIFIVSRRYTLSGSWRIDFSLQRQMLIRSYPLMINHMLATVYWQVDVLILSEMRGDTVVGWYNSAYKYVNAFNIIPSFFTFALFPVISRQVQSNINDARRTFRMSAKLLMLAALPLAAMVTILAPIMIQLLGGAAFVPEGQIALQVVIWSIPFGWLNSVTNYVLISLGQEKVQTRAFIAGVGFNIIANILIIPYLSFVGAGLTTIASEMLLLALFNYFLMQKMPAVRWVELLWRPVLITAVMMGGMLLANSINVWLAVAVGIVVYPAGLWLLRVFGQEELAILRSIVPQKIAERIGF